jgi:hypothetical protein
MLRVANHEKWNGGGPRGGSILKHLKHDIKSAFKDLGLWEPHLDLNHGQGSLCINGIDKEMLEEIVRKVNQRHN